MTHLTLCIAFGYILLLLIISRLIGGRVDNDTFFRGERQSPWWAVAFGMLGASLSGVSFVSVPGWVGTSGMTYLQMCLGFIVGYIIVAFVLLPIYYKGNYTSIYTYLEHRFGLSAYRTGASFFLLSKLTGAAVRLYLVCLILQRFVFDVYHIPFMVGALLVLVCIWLYTRRSGIRTVVWTDCVQTFVLLFALVLIIVVVLRSLQMSIPEAVDYISSNSMSRVFVFDDWASRQNFWKQFLSGIFVVIVMTGLDQDLMQKNLTCRTLRQSQLNMSVYGLLFVPVNLLFLSLGILLVGFASIHHIQLPTVGDEILPTLCASGALGDVAYALFTVGIVAAAFSSADSALTALTTSLCVDVFRRGDDERLRRIVHPFMALAMYVVILLVYVVGSNSVIDAVYMIASYTYGPLLGLFAFGIGTCRRPLSLAVPFICVFSMLACYLLSLWASLCYDYYFGYELLMINGSLTYALLYASSFWTDK